MRRIFLAALALLCLAMPARAVVVGDVNAGAGIYLGPLDFASLEASSLARVTDGTSTVFIGTRQVTRTNQNPFAARFTGGTLDWAVDSYETTGVDGRGRGVVWDGGGTLYAVFTVDGGSNDPGRMERHTTGGWLSGYGSGGGPIVSVLLRLDPATGLPTGEGTYVSALLSNGNTNTLAPTGLGLVEEGGVTRVLLEGMSFFAPRRTDGTRQSQTAPGGSPFPYQALFASDLSEALVSEAVGWDGVTALTDFHAMAAIPLPPAGLLLGGAVACMLLRRRG